MDHYLDTPFDLSKVLFVCTANSLDPIAKPLLDRMEIIRLSGYVLEEKMHIAEKYLIPAVKEETGMVRCGACWCAVVLIAAVQKDITMTPEAIRSLIKGYAREAGVRNLRKLIERVHRKAAFERVEAEKGKGRHVYVTEKKLEHYVGKPIFTKDRIYDVAPAGVVMGLAWTNMGGSVLYIECINSCVCSPPTNSTHSSADRRRVIVMARAGWRSAASLVT